MAPGFGREWTISETRYQTVEQVNENSLECLSTFAAECLQTSKAILEGFHRDLLAAYLRTVREGSAELRKLLEDAFCAGGLTYD